MLWIWHISCSIMWHVNVRTDDGWYLHFVPAPQVSNEKIKDIEEVKNKQLAGTVFRMQKVASEKISQLEQQMASMFTYEQMTDFTQKSKAPLVSQLRLMQQVRLSLETCSPSFLAKCVRPTTCSILSTWPPSNEITGDRGAYRGNWAI